MRQLLKYILIILSVLVIFYSLSDIEKEKTPTIILGDNKHISGTDLEVLDIVDGDTIDVFEDNTKTRVRLLGINSPESVDPRRPVECFGKEASDYIKTLLKGHKVRLTKDTTKPNADEYGRILRYIYRDDGIFINEKMIRDGYAYEYTYHGETYDFQKLFRTAQQDAVTNNRGLWAKGVCGK